MPAKPRSTPGPGRPKDLEKRAAILEAAKNLFPQRGFEGVSMDAIAAEAGVSKLTVYSHFTDKETLFSEAVKCRCEAQLPHDLFEMHPGAGPIREALARIACGFHALCTSPEAVDLYRMMSARAQNDPQLSQLFYEAGPRRMLAEFEAFLRQANAAGALEVPEPARAAQHFFAMLKGELHTRLVVGCCEQVPAAESAAHIDSVLDLFLRAYLPREAGGGRPV
jgi:TetR/AcrR family transcriptional regulator, mexJK operon transcriptional repressor